MNNNILNFLGFDSFTAVVKNGSGADAIDPVRTTYEGTPLAQELTVTYGLAWTLPADTNFQYNNAGVSSASRFRIGTGADARRTFLFGAGRYSVPATPTTQVITAVGRNTSATAGKPWGYRFGFYLTDFTQFPSTPTNSSIANVTLLMGGNLLPIATRAYSGGRLYWNISGVSAVNCPDIVVGQPTHIEIEIACLNPSSDAATNMSVVVKIWVNGDLVSTQTPWSIAQTSNFAIRLRFNANGSAQTFFNYYGLSDLVISKAVDAEGNALPNLGPQIVRRAATTSVIGENWLPFGTTSLSTAIASPSETLYINSPEPKTPLVIKNNLNILPGAEVNAMHVYVAAGREVAAAAGLNMSWSAARDEDGVSLGEAVRAVGSTLAYSKVLTAGYDGYPANLDFADTGRITLRLNVS